jgi:hypothetical protein
MDLLPVILHIVPVSLWRLEQYTVVSLAACWHIWKLLRLHVSRFLNTSQWSGGASVSIQHRDVLCLDLGGNGLAYYALKALAAQSCL